MFIPFSWGCSLQGCSLVTKMQRSGSLSGSFSESVVFAMIPGTLTINNIFYYYLHKRYADTWPMSKWGNHVKAVFWYSEICCKQKENDKTSIWVLYVFKPHLRRLTILNKAVLTQSRHNNANMNSQQQIRKLHNSMLYNK